MKKTLMTALMMSMILSISPVSAKSQAITYSNLVDQTTQKSVRKIMLKDGLTKRNVDRFFEDVNAYNKAIKNTSLVKKGYKTATPTYDSVKQSELWEKSQGTFIWNNCRITAYTLMKDKIRMSKSAKDTYQTLFMDESSLDDQPHPYFTKQEKKNFITYYAATGTKLTKNVNYQRKTYEKSMKQRGISYKKCKATLISVVMHSYFSKNEDYLFIGHTGVLLPYQNGYLFVEKLAFDAPYQAVKLRSKKQLKTYLMNTYDVDQNQPTAKPFIMENNRTLL